MSMVDTGTPSWSAMLCANEASSAAPAGDCASCDEVSVGVHGSDGVTTQPAGGLKVPSD
jgi:hypothetical protein